MLKIKRPEKKLHLGWRDKRLVDPNTVDFTKLPGQIKSGDPLPGGEEDPNQEDDEKEGDLNE